MKELLPLLPVRRCAPQDDAFGVSFPGVTFAAGVPRRREAGR
jgi:hypothetical protein